MRYNDENEYDAIQRAIDAMNASQVTTPQPVVQEPVVEVQPVVQQAVEPVVETVPTVETQPVVEPTPIVATPIVEPIEIETAVEETPTQITPEFVEEFNTFLHQTPETPEGYVSTKKYIKGWNPIRRYKMDGTVMVDIRVYETRAQFEADFGMSPNALNQVRQCANGYERVVVKRDKNGNMYETTQRVKSYKGFKWEWV